MPFRVFPLLTSLVAWFGVLIAAAELRADDAVEFFEKKIRPIFVEHCQSCHGEKKQEAALRLDSKPGWETGGDQGRAVVPNKPQDSLLIKMVRGEEGKPPQMPPENRLPPELVADLVKWVELGAPDPRTGVAKEVKGGIDWEAAAKHWAFQPVKSVEPPAVSDLRFQQPIDRFVGAGLKKAGLAPTQRAEKRVLLRRVTFGLTGLPPTAADVRSFLEDDSREAYAKVVDRLLASPQYGEHQARMWLDVARFAEDQAQSKEKIPNAWRYRDWVIESLNADLPYDQFLKYQLAADLMPQSPGSHRHLPALGLLGLGTTYPRPNDLARLKADEWDDRIDTITRGMLGLTVSCARCHDHKFDPIPTQDYYSLAGVMAGTTREAQIPFAAPEEIAAYDKAKAVADEAVAAAKALLQDESDRIALQKTDSFAQCALATWTYHARKAQQADLKWEDYAKEANLDAKSLQALDQYLKRDRGPSYPLSTWRTLLPAGGATEPPAAVRALAETFQAMAKKNLAEPLNKRNLDQQKELFGEQGVLPLTEATILPVASNDWKAEYAKLQAAVKAAQDKMPPAPPFCQAVKEEPTDRIKDLKVFVRGDPAKHGEVAPRRFLRIIAGENAPAFQQGSGRLELANTIASESNPLTARVIVNRIWQQHFGRGLVRSASNFGKLGTPPTHPELLDYLAAKFVKGGWSQKKLHREIVLSEAYQLSSEIIAANAAKDPENQWLWHMPQRRLTVEEFRDALLAVTGELDPALGGESGELDDPQFKRRTVYGKVSRHDLASVLRLFDFPNPTLTSDRRNETTLPQQMLFLLNSPFVIDRAKALAVRTTTTNDPAAQIQQVFVLALRRQPTEAEAAVATKYLSATDASKDAAKIKLSRLERLAQSLLISNEFYFID